MRPQHYLTIGGHARSFAIQMGANPEVWREEVFDDLTESGTCLVYEVLPPGPKGTVLGLCGARFYAQVCRDEFRDDALFMFRIDSANERKPKTVPKRFPAQFELMPDNRAEALHGEVIPLGELAGEATPALDRSPTVQFVAPTDELIGLLGGLSGVVFEKFRPGAASEDINLESLRRLFGAVPASDLGAFGARHEAILRGKINPKQDDRLLIELCSNFDVRLANRIASRPNGEVSLQVFVRELPKHSVTETTTVSIWAGSLAACDPDAIKVELHRCAQAISALSDQEPIAAFLREQLNKIALRYSDQSIAEIVERAEANPANTWKTLAHWAGEFVIQEPQDRGLSGASLSAQPIPEGPKAEAGRSVVERQGESQGAESVEVEIVGDAMPPDRQAVVDAVSWGSGAAPDPVLRWWLAQSLPHNATLSELVTGIERLIAVAAGDGVASASEIRDELRGVLCGVDALRASPAMEPSIDATIAKIRVTATSLSRAWSVEIGTILTDSTSQRALYSLGEHPALARMALYIPDWLARAAEMAELSDNGLSLGARSCLEDFEFAQRLLPYSAMLEHSDAVLKSIAQIDPPVPDEDAFAHFDRCTRQIIESFSETNSLGQLARNIVHHLVSRGLDSRLALAAGQRFETLIPRVSLDIAESIGDLLNSAEDESALDRCLDASERAIENVESLIGSAVDIRLDRWKSVLDKASAVVEPAAQITIRHAYVDGVSRRVPAYYFSHSNPTHPYGTIQLPLMLESRNPISAEVHLSIRVTSRHGDAWPGDWDRPGPENIHVRSQDWRRNEDTFQYAFALKVPIRNPDGVKERILRVEVSARDLTRQRDLPVATLEWDQLVKVEEKLRFEWSDNVRGDYVEQHPIGPQRRAGSLLESLRSGNNFAVVAPRRFGKSSLCEYLAGAARAQNLFVIASVCTRSHSLRHGSLQDVWAEISEALVDEFGVGIKGLPIDDIPPPDAFERARAAAKTKGYDGIILMFDEAQLLFSKRGSILGDQLKDALERAWTRTKRYASVQIGLIGLPSLQERCGANLAAMLRIQQDSIKETELNAVLLAFSRNQLHTTRAARIELADLAGRNLFILKVIVEALLERVDEDSRRWFNDRDVVSVYGQIRELVQRGEHQQISYYLRDSLNDADSVNDWLPKPCFPLAAALAWAHGRQGLAGLAAREEAHRLVEVWCEQAAKGCNIRYFYSELRLNEDLKSLSELAVYDQDKGFRSPLLQAYLVNQAERFPATDTEKNALIRCTIERLRTPKALHKEAEGGQAVVYRFEEDGLSFAWRSVALRTTADAQRFAESAHALVAIRDRIRHDDGGQFVYDLRRMGISEDNHGVEVYRWIEGRTLDASVTDNVRSAHIIELGWQLSRGVAMLHRNNVLHRDICPRNIIIGPGAVPILVDFGMARPVLADMNTPIASTWAAPEVQQGHPDWTEKADIFGLGATLDWLMRRAAEEDTPEWRKLVELVGRAKGHAPSNRPTAEEMVSTLEDLRLLVRTADKLEQVWCDILDCVGPLEKHRVFKQLLDDSRPDLQAACFGLYGGKLERCLTASSFLNKLVEGYTGSVESLGTLKRKGRPTLNNMPLDLRAVHLASEFRKATSHYRSDLNWRAKLIAAVGISDDEESTGLVCRLADQLGTAIGVSGLKDLLRYVCYGVRDTQSQ